MAPFWFVQQRAESKRDQALAYAALELGYPANTGPFGPEGVAALALPADRPVVCYGTFGLSKAISELPADSNLRVAHWAPNPERFDCRSWFVPWAPWLLQERWEFVPLGDVLERADELFDSYGVDGAVFLRPDGGDKDFNGGLVHREQLPVWRATAQRFDPSPSMLVLVAAPTRIGAEYRLFLAEGRVVAGSRYKEAGALRPDPDFPDAAAAWAETVAAAWSPEAVFTLDVADTPRGWRVVECNDFHCSGLYEADLPSLVAGVSAAAERAWQARGVTPARGRGACSRHRRAAVAR